MSLIAGLAVVTVPILLHLFGQRQPQLIDFPALKFVRQTTREQSSSWQLRHILLLMLRVLLLALLALALARPRVHSAMLGSVMGMTSVAIAASLATLIAAVAFVSRKPDENHEKVYRWLLERNLKMYGVTFALDNLGDIYLAGRIPLRAIDETELDRLIGCISQYSDGAFNTILELGFATAIRKEWAWRVSRGESTENLDAFAHLTEPQP